MAKKKTLTFEEGFKRLENIVDIMGGDDVSLEESLKLYKEGVDISLFLDGTLKEARKEVLILQNKTLCLFEPPIEDPEEEEYE